MATKDDRERTGRGRPAITRGQPSTPVNVRLPSATYDAACQRSLRGGVSVPTIVRRALSKYLDDEDS